MDNAIGLGIILSLQDRASAGLETIRNKITALRDVSQEMMMRFDEGMKQMIAGIGSIAAGTKIIETLKRTFSVPIYTAMNFEQAMSRVASVSGAAGEDFEKLTKQARDLGRDTQYSATQVANSQELLARAGFKVNEILTAMPHLLFMAGAEGMNMSRAVDIAAGTLRGFGMEASEMGRVANILAKISSSTNTSIDTLGESFKYVAPDAKALKVSIEEVAAIIGVMGDANIKGSQAGTYLRAAFNKLTSPTKKGKAALQQLGISLQDDKGELKSFYDLMTEFSVKMQGMSGLQKKKLFGDIFDTRSSTGMLAVMTAFESGKFKEALEKAYNPGDAAKGMYDRMNATLQGATRRLESATEGMRIAIGNYLLPVYTRVIDIMASFKSWLAGLIEEHPILTKSVILLTTSLIGLSGAALIVVGSLMSISGFIKMWPLLKIMAISSLSNIRQQANMALASISKLSVPISKLSVPIVGLIALAGVLYYAWRKNLWGIRDMVTAVTEGFKMALIASTEGIAEVDEELANKLKAAGIWDFAVTMGKVFFRVRRFWNGLVEGFKEGLDFLKGGLKWLKGIFSPVVESGQELLKFLGILKPVTKTQAETWKAWGQLIGRLAPIVLTVIAAFKGVSIVIGIIKAVTGAFALLNAVILSNPILAIVAVCVAAGIYLYTHWEEISEWFAELWDDIAGYAQAAADWVKEKWQAVADWWDSWTIADVFSPVIRYVQRVVNYVQRKIDEFKAWWDSWTLKDIFAPVVNWVISVKESVIQKMEELNAWWNSWTLKDVFAPIYDFAVEVIAKVKQPFIDFKNWLLGIFANLNPFNWELPSWLGGGKAGGNQGRNAQAIADGAGYYPPEIPAERVISRVPVKITPSNTLLPTPISDQSTKSIVSVVQPDMPALQNPTVSVVQQDMPALQNPTVSVVQQDMPALQNPTVSVEQADTRVISDRLASIDMLLGNVVNRDIEVSPPITPNATPSSPLLIQHSQNQATMAGQATVQAQEQSPERPVNVQNQVEVKVESKPVEIVLDGEKVGTAALRWIERQNTRSGMGIL